MALRSLPRTDIIHERKTELESLYRVLIHNDDVTPMDFVVHILQSIFAIDPPGAMDIMFRAHFTGLACVQVLPRNEAQNRIGRAHFAAGLEGFPLHFSMEPD